MEGFGMSAQEAAATAVPVVASHLVPFVVEYLLGDEAEEMPYDVGNRTVRVGDGAIVVQADDVAGFSFALAHMLSDQGRSRRMGERAYRATVPYFTWNRMTRAFLSTIGIEHE
jgi:glycosyltransferase involved in cell wall biosynthesis